MSRVVGVRHPVRVLASLPPLQGCLVHVVKGIEGDPCPPEDSKTNPTGASPVPPEGIHGVPLKGTLTCPHFRRQKKYLTRGSPSSLRPFGAVLLVLWKEYYHAFPPERILFCPLEGGLPFPPSRLVVSFVLWRVLHHLVPPERLFFCPQEGTPPSCPSRAVVFFVL